MAAPLNSSVISTILKTDENLYPKEQRPTVRCVQVAAARIGGGLVDGTARDLQEARGALLPLALTTEGHDQTAKQIRYEALTSLKQLLERDPLTKNSASDLYSLCSDLFDAMTEEKGIWKQDPKFQYKLAMAAAANITDILLQYSLQKTNKDARLSNVPADFKAKCQEVSQKFKDFATDDNLPLQFAISFLIEGTKRFQEDRSSIERCLELVGDIIAGTAKLAAKDISGASSSFIRFGKSVRTETKMKWFEHVLAIKKLEVEAKTNTQAFQNLVAFINKNQSKDWRIQYQAFITLGNLAITGTPDIQEKALNTLRGYLTYKNGFKSNVEFALKRHFLSTLAKISKELPDDTSNNNLRANARNILLTAQTDVSKDPNLKAYLQSKISTNPLWPEGSPLTDKSTPKRQTFSAAILPANAYGTASVAITSTGPTVILPTTSGGSPGATTEVDKALARDPTTVDKFLSNIFFGTTPRIVASWNIKHDFSLNGKGGIKFDDAGMKEVISILIEHPDIKTLDLTNQRASDSAIQILLEALTSGQISLTKFVVDFEFDTLPDGVPDEDTPNYKEITKHISSTQDSGTPFTFESKIPYNYMRVAYNLRKNHPDRFLDLALSYTDQALAMDPPDSLKKEVLYEKGALLSKRGDYADGEKAFQDSEQIDPNYYLPKVGLGNLYAKKARRLTSIPNKMKLYNDAIAKYNEANRILGDDHNREPLIYYYIAKAYYYIWARTLDFDSRESARNESLNIIERAIQGFTHKNDADGLRIANSTKKDLEDRVDRVLI